MFKNFSASYAGHVVDDNLGFEGTPANDRWYSNEKLAETYDWALEIAQHLELWPGVCLTVSNNCV